MIHLTWYGHACFRIQADGISIVTDPYTPESSGLKPIVEPADVVLMSSTLDEAHSYSAGVPGSPIVFNALEFVGRRTEIAPGVLIEAVAAMEGSDRPDDPKANALYRFEVDGLAILHMGDVGNPLGREQLDPIRQRVDVLLAVAGGGLTIPLPALHEAIAEIQPTVVIPMHYATPSLKYLVGPLDDFLAPYPPERVVRHQSSTLAVCGRERAEMAIHVLLPLLDPKATARPVAR